MRWRNVFLAALVVIGLGLLVASSWLAGHRSASASGSTIVAISAGGGGFPGSGHTCVLTTTGGVKCWGYNGFGQLGDGDPSTQDQPAPVDVEGLTTGVEAIAAGGYHTCALLKSGGVKCWGYNQNGQLGDGQACGSYICPTPVDVSGLTSGVVAIAAGNLATCALTTAGGVKCWGAYWDGTGIPRTTPVDVVGLESGVVAISAGHSETCALTTQGGVKCWGDNSVGELGDGQACGYSCTTPVDVSGLSNGVAAISAGPRHVCALTSTGDVKCWGYNHFGQLGDGSSQNIRTRPVDVTGLGGGVLAVAAGGGNYGGPDAGHTCAITAAGGLRCWGANSFGQLGDGTTTNQVTPVDVLGLGSGVLAASAGDLLTCADTSSGTVKCWGLGDRGQLGDGTSGYLLSRSTPVDVLGLGPKPTPTPVATPCPDLDGDTICDGSDGDIDGDGCPNVRELVTGPGAQNSGGNRDPNNPSDYFNPTHDGLNRIDDVLAAVRQYFIDQGNPNYNADTDRTPLGPNVWNLGPPNGLQRIDDILAIVAQYYHDCS